MRVKRALVLVALLGFLSLTLLFGILAFSGDQPEQTPASQNGPVQEPTDLNRDPGLVSSVEDQTSGVDPGFASIASLVSGIGALGSFVALRSEVRKEKDVIKARKSRTQFYKDMRTYNAQLKGPPRHNT